MNDINDIIALVQSRVDELAERKGYDDSYAYKYGAFTSAMGSVLEEVLTAKQYKEVTARAKKLYA